MLGHEKGRDTELQPLRFQTPDPELQTQGEHLCQVQGLDNATPTEAERTDVWMKPGSAF